MFRIQKLCICVTILWSGLSGDAFSGAFAEKPIYLDAQISGQPPVNDGRRTFPVLTKGDRIVIEVFIENVARGLTSGFTLAFEVRRANGWIDKLAFSEMFEIEGFDGILSSEVGGRGAAISVGGNPASLRSPGFLGRLTLKAIQNIPRNTEMRLRAESTTIFDSEIGVIDELDVRNATIRFITGQPFKVNLDLDKSAGNQSRTVRNGVAVGETVEVQIYGKSLDLMVGFILGFTYDPTMVAYEAFLPGTVFPSAQTVTPEINARSVKVTSATFGGAVNISEGLLGRLFFTVMDGFATSTVIRLNTAEMLRSSEFVTAVPQSITLNGAVDFDGNNTTDFRDFLLFASHFGEDLTSPNFDIQFDLDGNGEVGFRDFVILAVAIEAARQVSP